MPKYAGVEPETGLPMWYREENGATVTTTSYSEASDYLCGDPTPVIYGGFGTSVSFYGVDISAQFSYSVGGLVYDSGYAAVMRQIPHRWQLSELSECPDWLYIPSKDGG